MDQQLRRELLAMAEKDQRVRVATHSRTLDQHDPLWAEWRTVDHDNTTRMKVNRHAEKTTTTAPATMSNLRRLRNHLSRR